MIKSPFCGAYKIIILGHNHLCLTLTKKDISIRYIANKNIFKMEYAILFSGIIPTLQAQVSVPYTVSQ